MTKIEAIRQSLEKWVGICNSETPALKALNTCPLCRQCLRDISSCLHCPLELSNQGCFDQGSVWDQLRGLLVPPQAIDLCSVLTLKDIDSAELTSLCCQMRDALGVFLGAALRESWKDILCQK